MSSQPTQSVRGVIAKVPVPRLLYRMITEQETGQLIFRHVEQRVDIYFHKGDPQFISCNYPLNRIGQVLLKHGDLNYDQLLDAIAEHKQKGGVLTAILLRRRAVAPSVLLDRLREQAYLRVRMIFGWGTGRFEFVPGKTPPTDLVSLGIDPLHLLLDGIRESYDLLRLKRLFAPFAEARLVMSPNGSIDPTRFKLNQHEQKALTRLRESETVRDAINSFLQGRVDPLVGLQILYLLLQVDLCKLEGMASAATGITTPETIPDAVAGQPRPITPPVPPQAPLMQPAPRPASGQRPPAAPLSVPVAPAPPPGPFQFELHPAEAAAVAAPAFVMPDPAPAVAGSHARAPAAATIAAVPAAAATVESPATTAATAPGNASPELVAMAAAIEKKNLFERLGVGPEADDAAVKNAYLKLARTFHPDTVPASHPDRALKEKIFGMITEASGKLGKAEGRANYKAALETGHADEDQVDVSNIMQAEASFLRGKQLLGLGKLSKAEEFIAEAAELAPEPEYAAYLAWLQYLKAPGEPAVRDNAIKKLAAANSDAKRKFKNADLYLFLGRIYKNENLHDEAEREFQMCLKVEPQHIEAKRELRLLQTRKDKDSKDKASPLGLFTRRR